MRSTSGISIAAASLVVILALSSCAATEYSNGGSRTYFGFTLGIQSAPPPPRILFEATPRYVSIEDSDVEAVEVPDPNCDMFRYGGTFYVFSGGYWYRSDDYRGPYRLVEVRRVPRPVLMVPEGHWRHRPHWDRGRHRGWGHQGDDDRH
jgi:hypothetical protein